MLKKELKSQQILKQLIKGSVVKVGNQDKETRFEDQVKRS